MKPRRVIIMLASICCLLFASIVHSASLPTAVPEEVGLSSERLNRIDTIVKTDIAKHKLPGAVVLVARNGKVAYFKSFGMQDNATATPMKKDSIFRIYSMTKVVTSVAVMMLMEEGKLSLSDTVAKFIPAFKNVRVVDNIKKIEIIEKDKSGNKAKQVIEVVASTKRPLRPITIQDLLRHTSGLTYSFSSVSAVQRMYYDSGVKQSHKLTLKAWTGKLAKMPLAFQPGERWEYSRSTDLLGRVIEVVSGMPFDKFLAKTIFKPLGMIDTGFYVKPGKHNRIAEKDINIGKPWTLPNMKAPPKFLSGGSGLVSTASDYATFLQMLLNGGRLNDTRLLDRNTVEYMTRDHLGPIVKNSPGFYPGPGYGFGLGVAVRLSDGVSAMAGSIGDYYWMGMAGTSFFVNPKKNLLAIIMLQEPTQGDRYINLLRSLVMQSIIN